MSHLFAEDGSLFRYFHRRALTISTLSRITPLGATDVGPLDEQQGKREKQPRRVLHPAD